MQANHVRRLTMSKRPSYYFIKSVVSRMLNETITFNFP